MHSNTRIYYLFQQYLAKSISQEEYDELSAWISQSDFESMDDLLEVFTANEDAWSKQDLSFDEAAVMARIKDRLQGSSRKTIRIKRWQYAVAASAIIVLFLLFKPKQLKDAIGLDPEGKEQTSRLTYTSDIDLLEGKGGYLSFADGAVIAINEQHNSFLDRDSIRYQFLADGGVRLEPSRPERPTVGSHKLWTNKGDKAYVVLEDGTSVWLSSSSSLVFPARFMGDRRIVEVVGEAFFEVSHNPTKPFIVKTKHNEVEVLGTEFNLRAYPEFDFSQTTLFSGSVSVKTGSDELKIIPGEQAIGNADGRLSVAKVNLHDVRSWQTDVYQFSDLTIMGILEELSRWYAVDGIDNRSLGTDRYTGTLSKAKKLSDILKQLEIISTNKFSIEEGRVVIMD